MNEFFNNLTWRDKITVIDTFIRSEDDSNFLNKNESLQNNLKEIYNSILNEKIKIEPKQISSIINNKQSYPCKEEFLNILQNATQDFIPHTIHIKNSKENTDFEFFSNTLKKFNPEINFDKKTIKTLIDSFLKPTEQEKNISLYLNENNLFKISEKENKLQKQGITFNQFLDEAYRKNSDNYVLKSILKHKVLYSVYENFITNPDDPHKPKELYGRVNNFSSFEKANDYFNFISKKYFDNSNIEQKKDFINCELKSKIINPNDEETLKYFDKQKYIDCINPENSFGKLNSNDLHLILNNDLKNNFNLISLEKCKIFTKAMILNKKEISKNENENKINIVDSKTNKLEKKLSFNELDDYLTKYLFKNLLIKNEYNNILLSENKDLKKHLNEISEKELKLDKLKEQFKLKEETHNNIYSKFEEIQNKKPQTKIALSYLKLINPLELSKQEKIISMLPNFIQKIDQENNVKVQNNESLKENNKGNIGHSGR